MRLLAVCDEGAAPDRQYEGDRRILYARIVRPRAQKWFHYGKSHFGWQTYSERDYSEHKRDWWQGAEPDIELFVMSRLDKDNKKTGAKRGDSAVLRPCWNKVKDLSNEEAGVLAVRYLFIAISNYIVGEVSKDDPREALTKTCLKTLEKFPEFVETTPPRHEGRRWKRDDRRFTLSDDEGHSWPFDPSLDGYQVANAFESRSEGKRRKSFDVRIPEPKHIGPFLATEAFPKLKHQLNVGQTRDLLAAVFDVPLKVEHTQLDEGRTATTDDDCAIHAAPLSDEASLIRLADEIVLAFEVEEGVPLDPPSQARDKGWAGRFLLGCFLYEGWRMENGGKYGLSKGGVEAAYRHLGVGWDAFKKRKIVALKTIGEILRSFSEADWASTEIEAALQIIRERFPHRKPECLASGDLNMGELFPADDDETPPDDEGDESPSDTEEP